MKENEQIQPSEPDENRIRNFEHEPFTYDPIDKGRAFPPSFWLQWGLLLVVAFYFLSILVEGFADMHRYGIQETTGINYIFLIAKEEKVFFAALLFCLPAAAFFAAFLDRKLPGNLLEKISVLTQGKNPKKLVAAMMVLVGIAVVFITYGILGGTPIADDENVYEFQTRIMATGHLTLPGKAAPNDLFEDNIFLVNNGRIFGQYPFGQSALLLPGYLAGSIHLIPIILAILTVLGVYLLGMELYDRRVGLIAAALVAFSPMFLFTSGTLLAHVPTMFFLTFFGYFAIKTVKTDKLLWSVLCGLFFGIAFNIRGATTLLVGFPAALLLAVTMFKKPKANLAKIALLALTVGGSVGIMLYLNWLVNGDPMHTNYHAAWIGKTQFDSPFGFGKGAWRIIHTPTQGFMNLINNFIRLNAWTFGWPIGFLFVIAWAATKGRTLVDYVLAIPIVITFVGYFFYFWPGISDTGPVLYFELLLPVALLSARGLIKSPVLLKKWMPEKLAARRIALFTIMMTVLALCTFHFYNARALAQIKEAVDEPYTEIKIPEGQKALVFTDYYLKEGDQGSWVAGRKNTHPDLGDEVIYVLNFGKTKNQEFKDEFYPDYEAYVFYYTHGIAHFVPLAEYDVDNYLKNYPDSR